MFLPGRLLSELTWTLDAAAQVNPTFSLAAQDFELYASRDPWLDVEIKVITGALAVKSTSVIAKNTANDLKRSPAQHIYDMRPTVQRWYFQIGFAPNKTLIGLQWQVTRWPTM